MEARVCRETSVSLLPHIKMMPLSTWCHTHYSCLTLGAQIIFCCRETCEFVYISARNRCLSQKHICFTRTFPHVNKKKTKNNPLQQHPSAVCSFTAQGFKTGIRKIGSALKPPEDDDARLSQSPSPHFLSTTWCWENRKLGIKTKPLSTSECIHLCLRTTPLCSSVAFFVRNKPIAVVRQPCIMYLQTHLLI